MCGPRQDDVLNRLRDRFNRVETRASSDRISLSRSRLPGGGIHAPETIARKNENIKGWQAQKQENRVTKVSVNKTSAQHNTRMHGDDSLAELPLGLFRIRVFSLRKREDTKPVPGVRRGATKRRTIISPKQHPIRVYADNSPDFPDDSVPIEAVIYPNQSYEYLGIRLIVCPGTETEVYYLIFD